MPRTCIPPRFTEANKLFMYRLLRDQLGCGKQTFITRVEEVLTQDRLTADDLGFGSTLELLEALGSEVVKITLFKGGRAYATILAREDWDKALAAPESKAPAKGNKPWKKKKGDKSIKPSCPKRVKRKEHPVETSADEAEGAPTEKDGTLNQAAVELDRKRSSGDETPVETTDAPMTAPNADPRLRNANFSLEGLDSQTNDPAVEEVLENASTTPPGPESLPAAQNAQDSAMSTEETAARSPHIALTVTYDPYSDQQGESSLIATPEELAKRAAEKAAAEAARRAAKEAAAAAARAVQIARERRAAVIAATIAERAAQKESEAARKPDGAENRAQSHSQAPADQNHTEMRNEGSGSLDVSDNDETQSPSASQKAPAPDFERVPEPKQEPTLDEYEQGSDDHIDPASTAAGAAVEAVPAETSLPSDFPLDFSKEVFCPGTLLHALTMLYPYGADVMGIVSEYCLIARERGSIEASRSKATFQICYLLDGQRATADVVIRRRGAATMGAAWAIDAVTVTGASDSE